MRNVWSLFIAYWFLFSMEFKKSMIVEWSEEEYVPMLVELKIKTSCTRFINLFYLNLVTQFALFSCVGEITNCNSRIFFFWKWSIFQTRTTWICLLYGIWSKWKNIDLWGWRFLQKQMKEYSKCKKKLLHLKKKKNLKIDELIEKNRPIKQRDNSRKEEISLLMEMHNSNERHVYSFLCIYS